MHQVAIICINLFQLRELHHDNLNQFVGANLEPENCYVLTMYCPKGSLQVIVSPLQSKRQKITLVITGKKNYVDVLIKFNYKSKK